MIQAERRAMSTFRELDVELANGAIAHYATAGAGNDVVVLLHGGLPGSSGAAGWRLMLDALAAEGFRVLAPDRPGFGKADAREKFHPTRGIKSWEEFVHDFVQALRLDRFFLAGNSQGAQIAAHYAVNHFERLRGVAFIASAGLSKSLAIPPEELVAGSLPPRFVGDESSMRAALEHVVRRKEHLSDSLIARRTAAANAQADAYRAGMEAVNRASDPDLAQWLDISERLNKLTLPMIYLHGQQDLLSPVANAYLQERQLPNVQFFYPDDCGHQGQTDQPEMFAQVLLELFQDGRVSKTTAEWAGVSSRRPPLAELVEP
jgi:2-hydroxy-6-oxonona-2,4-dienedioate hydrolase